MKYRVSRSTHFSINNTKIWLKLLLKFLYFTGSAVAYLLLVDYKLEKSEFACLLAQLGWCVNRN